MDIVVVTPCQLAPNVGTLCAGVTASVAPTLAIFDSPASGEPICFGSLEFLLHSPASRPAFDSLHEGMDLAFGAFRFHVNTLGALCLPDQIRSALTEPMSPSTTLAPSSPSSVGSSDEPESTPATIFCVDCDAHHILSPVDSVELHDVDSADHGSCNSSAYPTHFLCAAIINSADVAGNANGGPTNRPTINISPEAWNKAKEALRGSVPMPEDSAWEELMAYHQLLYQQHTQLATA